ncbi:MAG: hypothetical protein JOZ92_02155, partial [Candidatus Dormibacteraeota bacterium]|nr:hypothetical protein [Candidatus Dormibacteraeota bacterium]
VSIRPGSAGADPQGKPCPPVAQTQSTSTGAFLIFPTFTMNALGGYDGVEPDFGYNQPYAIPPGGDPSQDVIGELATEVTVPGHVIGVLANIRSYGTWQDATPGVAPYGGHCAGVVFTFGTPFLANNAPPPPPATTIVQAPPFAQGAALVAEISHGWHIGSIATLPGPAATATTYVHIPTCTWLQSGVPQQPVQLHAIKAVQEDGLTLFLVYNLTVTPGAVTWTWGDGTQSQSGPDEQPPSAIPQYNATAQTWTDPCAVSHRYPAVSSGVGISASQTFTVSITVSWSDGVAVHTAPVACDPVTQGPCALTIGAADGWSSGPHPVAQIEPVPYLPPPPPAP